ncbi:MAG: exodeoxyribonuclease V subunit gamma [Clostridia bacterium]|nr:exodeoxyribonuclease V subunit gamma [Clostridia bacterium]
MLSFICGTDETEKLNEIYRRAQTDAELGKSVYILVPEQYSMSAEKELISTLGFSAQSRIQILTFSRLCNLIFSKMGPLRTNYMDKAGKHIMTKRALLLCEKELSYLKRNVRQRGFVKLISSLISEFKRYGVTPGDLLDTSDKTSDSRLSLKLCDLSLIYKTFDGLILENHSNSEDNLSLIIPKIKDAKFLQGTFYINFFRSFTPTEYAIISEIMQISDVCVSLCTDKTDGTSLVFSSQINTFKNLMFLAEKLDIKTAAPDFIDNQASVHPDLLHLRENLFSLKPESFDREPEHIHLLRPDNFHSEVSMCAQLIKKLLREENYSLGDILVLTGNMENYEHLIPQIFGEYDIPFFLDQKTVLTKSPFMRMVLSVLEILAYGFSYERIMQVAKSGFFPVDRKDCDVFENYILAASINHAAWNNRGEWTFNPDSLSFNMEEINRIKAILIHPILDLLDMFSSRKTTKAIVENLFLWMEKMNFPSIVDQKISELKAQLNTESAEQLRMVWNSFVSVANQIADFMQTENSTFADFYELFSSACGELSVGIIPPTQDTVTISPVDLFRSTGSKAVILLGALDGVFPKSHTGEGLISDAERLLLKDAGLTLAPDNLSAQQEEQFLVYSVISTPREQLFVFAPLSDRDGKTLKPSDLVYSLKTDLFPYMKEVSQTSHFDLLKFQSRKITLRHLAEKLFQNDWSEDALSPVWKEALSCLCNFPEYKKNLDTLYKINSHKEPHDALTKETAKCLYGENLIMSVSKLEKYNACAFSFFMQYGLFAKERLIGGLKATDTGTLLHSVLCDYFKNKAETNVDYSSVSHDRCFDEISQLVENAGKTLNETLYQSSHYYKYMLLRMKNIATSTAWKLIQFYAQSKFRPSGFEISFGKNGKYPPYTLDTAHGTVSLKGFVDRIDSAEIGDKSYIIITDYKSSEKKLDTELARLGVRFQPLVYANALTKGYPDNHIAAMFYLEMGDPYLQYTFEPEDFDREKSMSDKISVHGLVLDSPEVVRGIDKSFDDKDAIHYIRLNPKSLLTEEHFSEVLNAADQKAIETAENILDGKIDINPIFSSGFDACGYCPYSGICMKNK